MVKTCRILLIVVTALLLGSCSVTRYVPDGMYLLNDVKIKMMDDAESTGSARAGTRSAPTASMLKNYVRQKGNSRWFSAFKLPLAAYSLSGRDSAKWVNRALKSMGEAPVLFDSTQARLSCNDLQQQMQNEGYLDAQVELWTRTRGKRIDAFYKLSPGQPYYLRSVRYDIGDPQIEQLLHLSDSTNQGLHAGQLFRVADLDAERKRITTLLTERGYYRFHKEYIRFEADTTCGNHGIDVTLKLDRLHVDDDQTDGKDTLHTRYRIGRIDYRSGDYKSPQTAPEDTVIHLRRHVLTESTYLTSGSYYSSSDLQDTYNHFGRLGAVKYTNITFREHPDQALLDCDIQLQTNKPSTISFQPEGTNTAGDLGAAVSLTYQNLNLFRGSEKLSVELRGAYEAIRGLEGYRNQDFVEYSMAARLQFPRFIMPFISRSVRRSVNATSEVSLLYDLQDRPEFHRRVLSAGWSYKWNPQGHRDHYQFDLLDLNYVFMPWISETFKTQYLEDDNSRNAILRYNYEDMFITKIGFGYSYSNGRIAVKTNIETSGNVLNFASNVFGANKDEHGQYRLFNIAYAQYAKGDVDFTRSIRFDYNNQLVLHVGFGVAYPYGNSTVLPFEKRYFAGGANSVRGWSVRSLGPGRFKGHDGAIDFINQTGDMKLDLNAEYRAHLFWKLGGALFIDAGNIWTLRQYKEQPGGQFRLEDFPSQIAASYGLGLRFNFDYFIVRFDLGMKAVNPAYQEEDEEHYPLVHPRFSRDYAFHFAVGLPF